MMKFKRIAFRELDQYNLPNYSRTNYLSKQEISVANIYDKINWVHANPSEPGIVDQTEEVSICSRQRRNLLKTLKDYLIGTPRLIFIKGKRGSGKTYLQNYFLNILMPKLPNMTWFRVDVTKIYTYNSQHAKSLTFKEYLWAQIAFVFFRYAEPLKEHGIDQYFKTIYNHNINDIFVGTTMQNNKSKRHEYIKSIREAEHRVDGLKGKPFSNSETEKVAKNILKLLSEKKIRVVLFIDGIDNVNTASRDFNALKNQISDFIKRQLQDDTKLFDKVVYATRSELDTHYTLLDTIQKMNNFDPNINGDINVPSIDIELLFEKIEKIAEAESEAIPENFIADVKLIKENIETYFSNKYSINNVSYVDTIFDGDIREAFFVLLRIYFFAKVFIVSRPKTYPTIEAFYDDNESRAIALFIEALFKNGCLYAPDVRDISFNQPVRGLGFTNIFNPNFYFETNNTPLLALTGLELLLKKQFIIMDFVNELRDKINNKQAKEILYKLAELNYVTIDGNITITQKGKFVFNETLSNVDVFGANIFYALREKAFPLDIRIHEPNGRGYQKTLLHNIPTYIAFLEKVSDTDIDFVEHIRNSYIELFSNAKISEDDIVSGLSEDAQDVFYDLVYTGNSECIDNIREMRRIKLYTVLKKFNSDKTELFQEAIESLKAEDVNLSPYDLKVLFVLRIFNIHNRSKFIWSIEDTGKSFLEEVEDSVKLQACLEIDDQNHSLSDIERIIQPYLEHLKFYVTVTKEIGGLIKSFCETLEQKPAVKRKK